MKKFYAYIDESGQDKGSKFFVVVAVISEKQEMEEVKDSLVKIENEAGTGRKKWHKVRHENRMRYLGFVLDQKVAAGCVYLKYYPKPIPYFFSLVDVVKDAVRAEIEDDESYLLYLFVDGLDKKKTREMTNALRSSGISVRMPRKGPRDENEPIIRLADMWAGCMRSALLNKPDCRAIVERAEKEGYINLVT